MTIHYPHPTTPWRAKLHEIIFGTDTRTGKAFDVILLWSILVSVLVVMLESVREIYFAYGDVLDFAEWGFTILFSLEYLLRILSVRRPARYALSFFGLVDLFAILPAYLGLIMPEAESLLVIRTLRLLRVFRVFKLSNFLDQAEVLRAAVKSSMPKITVFLGTVVAVVVIVGTMMYLIEGEENGFTSIPASIYWAIVTMTTVGFGDIVPHTVLGKMLASTLMIAGYAIIAVPTGIVTVELSRQSRISLDLRSCVSCNSRGHDGDAKFCKHCGGDLSIV